MNEEQLTSILQKHQKWLSGEEGERANLRGADLRGANLWGASLREADLWGANLGEANLGGADLWGADLGGANLWGANLREANLWEANLRGADLREANLWGANLRGADLWGADLWGASLREANLREANLRGANLGGADLGGADLGDTIFNKINWLIWIGITPDKNGDAYAYKLTNNKGEGVFNGGINYLDTDTFKVAKVDPDVYTQCSYGINLATFKWCLDNKHNSTNRLFLMRFNVKDAVCPVASDGKFRVKRCTKVGECDWKGGIK